jgi:hypothetical protein
MQGVAFFSGNRMFLIYLSGKERSDLLLQRFQRSNDLGALKSKRFELRIVITITTIFASVTRRLIGLTPICVLPT